MEQILEKSEGVFLYVERFCDEVQQNHLSLDRPEQFPQGLGGIFCQWFQRQFHDLENFREHVRPALRAILAAREPLPVEILQHLFHWQDEELRDFTRTLGSLFPITKEANGEVIRPYHKSLSDWLAEQSVAGSFFVSAGEGHRKLAVGLLREHRVGKASRFCLRNLPYHLLKADRCADAKTLLGESGWIQKKRITLGVEAILSDLDLIIRHAVEHRDWSLGLGAAVAAALTVEEAFQVPPTELIPIYARAGLGEHAVEMAQFIEDEYSRAYLLVDIANAVEASAPELARRIRRQLWSSCKCESNTDHVIVSRLAYADPAELVSFLRECSADLHRKIIGCLLENENTVHRLVDLPESAIASICARLASVPGDLTEHEALFIAGFDPDLQRADGRVDLPDARLVLECRKLTELESPGRAEAISRAMVGVRLSPSSYIQLAVRALLRISPTESIAGARQRGDPEERIRLLVETSLGLVRSDRFDQAMAGILEAKHLAELEEHHHNPSFGNGVYSSEVEWVAEGVIRRIAKTDRRRALTLATESGLQQLTQTNLQLVVLWELPNYEEVKEAARTFNVPDWMHATTLRAAHDLAGAYETWKQNKRQNTDELKAMLKNARPDEGALILRLLREEVLPRMRPERYPADTTALQIEIARAVAAVKPKKAARMLDSVRFQPCDYDSRRDLIAVLPSLALAGQPGKALSLAIHLDKDDVGFGAMAIAEIVRLSHAGLIQYDEDSYLRFDFQWALRKLKGHNLSSRAVELFLSRPWMWANARVVVSIGRPFTPRPHEWRMKHTFAVIAGKATAYWQEIRQAMERRLKTPEDRELALCEASQWMPIEDWPMLEDIQKPALAAIAWARMARRAVCASDRKEWNRRVEIAADLWPDSEDGEALDILWVFVAEIGGWSDLSRKLAGRLLEQCVSKNMYWTAPALLAANIPGVFDADQRGRIATLARGWQDWMHTFKFAQRPIFVDDANGLAAEHLTRLADVWWKTDATRARECLNMALDHAREAKADSGRWDVQTEALRCWARHGDAEDWKQALACWRWGPAFLHAADSFVARWSALDDRAYAESQMKTIEWAHTVSENVMNAI